MTNRSAKIFFEQCGGCFFFQAEDGIRDAQESRGLGDVYKRQICVCVPVTRYSPPCGMMLLGRRVRTVVLPRNHWTSVTSPCTVSVLLPGGMEENSCSTSVRSNFTVISSTPSWSLSANDGGEQGLGGYPTVSFRRRLDRLIACGSSPAGSSSVTFTHLP